MLFRKNEKNIPRGVLIAPADGQVIPLSKVPDEVFAQGILGKGGAIEPRGEEICSPADATVVNIAETRHASSLLTEDGLELLVHVGIDTVTLKGEGFECTVKEGDRVRAGDPLVRIDRTRLESAGCPLTTPVVISNPELLDHLELCSGIAEGGRTPMLTYRRKSN